MARVLTNGHVETKRRGATKSFPLTPFKDVLPLARSIQEHGVDGQLRRITVFDRLDRSPESSLSRQMVTDSARYGLTSGSYGAEYLRLTDRGKRTVDPAFSERDRKRAEFEHSIGSVEPFVALYDRLKGKRLPAADVLRDQMSDVPNDDREQCARVFLENARYLGLVQREAGADRIISMEQLLEKAGALPGKATETKTGEQPDRGSETRVDRKPSPPTSDPEIHIDVNIHIDQNASSEQIEALFASMARHLYRRPDKTDE